MAAGGGEEDHSNVIKIAEQLAHVEIKAWQNSQACGQSAQTTAV
jgi:hypothetical protein